MTSSSYRISVDRVMLLFGALALVLISCRTVESQRKTQEQERRTLQASIDSAIRVERSKGIFIDTTNASHVGRDLPFMIFSEGQLHRSLADTTWHTSRDSSYSVEALQMYRVGVSDNFGKVIFGAPDVALARPHFYERAGPAMAAASARLEAVDTPDAKEFPTAALKISLRHPRSVLTDYIELQLLDQGWPSRTEVQRAGDSTVVNFITKYLSEPSSQNERRARRVSYMISLSSGVDRRCTQVAVRWLTKSRGERESTWTTLESDSTYEPSKRTRVSIWFKELEPCRK